MDKSMNIAVVGAGVVGLSTAVSIQKRIPKATVKIFADKFGSETLSDGAGGLYRPEANIDPNKEKLYKWCKDSLKYFLDLAYSGEAGVAGVQTVSGYYLSSSDKSIHKNEFLESLLPVFRSMTAKEMEMFPKKYKEGVFFTTVIADCRYYLPWLEQQFEKSGGIIERKHISRLSEISEDFHVIVNCSGLGARDLLDDNQLVPVRGQTIKVKAPWIKHFYYGDGVYVIPGSDYVTLGGIKDYGSWDMNVNPYQKQFIWDSCVKLVPSLQNAEVKWDWVGLRPHRSAVCLGASIIQDRGKLLKVVNNYGHGGHGVTLSWGTATEASQLTEKLLTDAQLISRL